MDHFLDNVAELNRLIEVAEHTSLRSTGEHEAVREKVLGLTYPPRDSQISLEQGLVALTQLTALNARLYTLDVDNWEINESLDACLLQLDRHLEDNRGQGRIVRKLQNIHEFLPETSKHPASKIIEKAVKSMSQRPTIAECRQIEAVPQQTFVRRFERKDVQHHDFYQKCQDLEHLINVANMTRELSRLVKAPITKSRSRLNLSKETFSGIVAAASKWTLVPVVLHESIQDIIRLTKIAFDIEEMGADVTEINQVLYLMLRNFQYSAKDNSHDQNSNTLSDLRHLEKQLPKCLKSILQNIMSDLQEFESNTDWGAEFQTVAPAPTSNAWWEELSVELWSKDQVGDWLKKSGFHRHVIDEFRQHEISGAVLQQLRIEDLKKLNISPMGVRFSLWKEMQKLRMAVETKNPRSRDECAITPEILEDRIDDHTPKNQKIALNENFKLKENHQSSVDQPKPKTTAHESMSNGTELPTEEPKHLEKKLLSTAESGHTNIGGTGTGSSKSSLSGSQTLAKDRTTLADGFNSDQAKTKAGVPYRWPSVGEINSNAFQASSASSAGTLTPSTTSPQQQTQGKQEPEENLPYFNPHTRKVEFNASDVSEPTRQAPLNPTIKAFVGAKFGRSRGAENRAFPFGPSDAYVGQNSVWQSAPTTASVRTDRFIPLESAPGLAGVRTDPNAAWESAPTTAGVRTDSNPGWKSAQTSNSGWQLDDDQSYSSHYHPYFDQSYDPQPEWQPHGGNHDWPNGSCG